MSDKIIRAVAKDGMVRIIAGTTTNLVEDARVIHLRSIELHYKKIIY